MPNYIFIIVAVFIFVTNVDCAPRNIKSRTTRAPTKISSKHVEPAWKQLASSGPRKVTVKLLNEIPSNNENKRSLSMPPENLHVEVYVGKKKIKLNLKPKYVLTKEFKVLKAESDDGPLMELALPKNFLHIMPGHVYTSLNNKASLHVFMEKARMKVEGILDNNNKIVYDQKVHRRSFEHSVHVIDTIHVSQFHPTNSTYSKRTNKSTKKRNNAKQIPGKRRKRSKKARENYQADAVVPDVDELYRKIYEDVAHEMDDPVLDVDDWYPPSKGGSNSSGQGSRSYSDGGSINLFPRQATLEIWVVYDDPNTQAFDEDEAKIIMYLSTFWYKVSSFYENDTAHPKIRISIAGVILTSKEVTKTILGPPVEDGVDIDETLGRLKDWVAKKVTDEVSMKEMDCIVFQTSYKLYDSVKSELYPARAMQNESCPSYVVLTDEAGDYGSYTHAANALHTVFGTELDREEKGCKSSDGFLLYTDRLGGDLKKLKFSPCSLKKMQEYVLQPEQNCLWDDPSIFFPEDLLPGAETTLTEQCIQGTDDDDATFIGKINDEVCSKLMCNNGTGEYEVEGGALDGSTCGYRKICIYNRCVRFLYPTMYELCAADGENLLPDLTGEPCEELKCMHTNGSESEDVFRPIEGTPCGEGQMACIGGNCTALPHKERK